MNAKLLLLLFGVLDPSVSVSANTPEAAVVKLATLSAPERPAPDLPDQVFAGLPRPNPGIEFRATQLRGRSLRKLLVRVVATHDGRRLADRSYAFSWKTSVAVVVPVRDIAPGEVVRRTDLAPKTLETSGAVERYALAPEQLVGRLARVTLSKNRPVVLRDVVLPKVIKRGGEISVRATFGALTVTTKAVALQAGSIGDVIRVRNLATRKQLDVRIVDFEIAEVVR